MAYSPKQEREKFDFFTTGKQSFIGQFGYYDDDEGGVIDGKGLASIDPLKGPRYGNRKYTVQAFDHPGPDNIRETDPNDPTAMEAPVPDIVRTDPLEPSWHPAADDSLEWVEEVGEPPKSGGKKKNTNKKLSKASYATLSRQSYQAKKMYRDRNRYIDSGGPFLGPAAHNQIKTQLVTAGRVPITNQVRGKEMRKQTHVPNGQVYGDGAGQSSYGGGGGPRKSYQLSKEQQTISQTALFEVYPKEEFPLYGRYPPHYGRFLIRSNNQPTQYEQSGSAAYGSTIQNTLNNRTRPIINNHNHGFPFIASHTNSRIP